MNVTRSFSYTIGNLKASRQQQEQLKVNGKSGPTKSTDGIKTRSSFSFSISDAFGLGKSNSNTNVFNKSNSNKLQQTLTVGNDLRKTGNSNSSINLSSNSFDKCKESDVRHKIEEVRFDLNSEPISSIETPMYLLSESLSTNDLQNGSAYAKNDMEELQNVYDFQHVSYT